jgi:hypothetical protein
MWAAFPAIRAQECDALLVRRTRHFERQNIVVIARLRGISLVIKMGISSRGSRHSGRRSHCDQAAVRDAPSRDCAETMAQVKVPLRPVGAARP